MFNDERISIFGRMGDIIGTKLCGCVRKEYMASILYLLKQCIKID